MKGQIRERKGKRKTSYDVIVYAGRDPTTGKELRKWATFRTRAEAERHLHKLLVRLEGGGTVAVGRQRLGDYLSDWLQARKPHLAPTAFVSYSDTVDLHLKPPLGHIPLAKLQPPPIRDYITAKLEAGLSGTTVKYHISILRMALTQAITDGLVERNVAGREFVKAPPKAQREMRILDVESARLFLGEARRSSKFFRLYMAALLTAARQGELLGIRWSDCNFALGRAAIRQTLSRLGGCKRTGRKAQLLFGPPKTKKARTVPLAPELAAELLALREEQKERKRKFGSRYEDRDLVFCQPTGRPLHARNVIRDFHEVLTRAKLPQIRFHDLRHSTASLLLALGVNVKVVQGLLGHESGEMTIDVYGHALPGMAEEAAQAWAHLLLAPPVENPVENGPQPKEAN